MNAFIEPKIKPLVEALTSLGIKTFSSCEGHEHEERWDVPHVTFKCNDNELLSNISSKLFKTLWKIVLNDDKKALTVTTQEDGNKEYGLHYILRPIPELSGATLEDLQAEIPMIAKKLNESNEPQEIENRFPVLQCPNCENESFTISGYMDFDLEYSQARIPQLAFDWERDINIICRECGEELEVDDPAFLFSEILSSAKWI